MLNRNFTAILLLLLSILPASADDTETQNIRLDGYIIAGNVRVRETYSTDSKVLGFLKIGTAVRCEAVTTTKFRIGTDSAYWYKCTPRAFGVTGWVYGKFISKEKFDTKQYINSLKPVKFNSVLYTSLINSIWGYCEPSPPNDCDSVSFDPTTITAGGMEGVFTYHIESIIETGNTITVVARLIMSNISIEKDPDEKVKYVITGINRKTIRLNGATLYRLK